MSENIEGGTYGVEVDNVIAAGLVVDEVQAEQPAEENSDPNGEEATVDGQPQEIEQQDQAKEAPAEEEVTSFELDGKSYSLEELRSHRDDSQNRSEWFKSNTQKAQDVSTERKTLEQEVKKWDALKDDTELMDTLKDYLGDEHELFHKTAVPSEGATQDTKEPKVDTEMSTRLSELEDKLEMQEADAAVQKDIGALIKAHPELDGEVDALNEVLNTAVDKGMTSLEDAFVLTHHQATVDSAIAKAVKKLEEANASKAIPEANVKHSGEKSQTNAKPKDFDEARKMALSSYDLYQ